MPGDDDRLLLERFADGDCTDEEAVRALELLRDEPGALEELASRHRFKLRVGQAMREVAMPGAVKAELTQAVAGEGEAGETSEQSSGPVLGRIGRWVPAAVAAMLLLAAGVAYLATPASRDPLPGPVVVDDWPADAVMPEATARAFVTRHVRCTTGVEPLDHEVRTLPAAAGLMPELQPWMQRQIDGEAAALDMTGMDFGFVKAGACPVPGEAAVHLIYRNNQPGRTDHLSLWVQAFPADAAATTSGASLLGLQPGKVHTIFPLHSDHPMLVWTDGERVYFLIGDAPGAVQQAAEHLTGHTRIARDAPDPREKA